jgi:hypothetical protein
MMVVMARDGAVPQSEAERAALYRDFWAYTGVYRADAEKWVADVDVAWNPGWKGEQVRFYKIVGDRMDVTSNWRSAHALPGKPIVRDYLIWERAATLRGEGPAPLTGIWRFVSEWRELQSTGQRLKQPGRTGYLLFLPEGRMIVVLAKKDGAAPRTEQERAALYESTIAYTGPYRADEEKWITKVEVASKPERKGEQLRHYKVNGDRLEVTEPRWWRARDLPGNPLVRTGLAWVRVSPATAAPAEEEAHSQYWKACRNGDVAAVRQMLDRGMSPNATFAGGVTPLFARDRLLVRAPRGGRALAAY